MTIWIMATGVGMAILSGIFWCLEAMPFVKSVKGLKPPKSGVNIIANLKYCVTFIQAFISLWRLALDIGITIWLVGSLGFTGLIGSIIGLTISNVISVFLLVIGRRSK